MASYGIRIFSEDKELLYDFGKDVLFNNLRDTNITMDLIEENFNCICERYRNRYVEQNIPIEYVRIDYIFEDKDFFEAMNDLYDLLKSKGLEIKIEAD